MATATAAGVEFHLALSGGEMAEHLHIAATPTNPTPSLRKRTTTSTTTIMVVGRRLIMLVWYHLLGTRFNLEESGSKILKLNGDAVLLAFGIVSHLI